MIRRLIVLFTLLFALVSFPTLSSAQEQKCSGDPQACAQIVELQKDLAAQKALAQKAAADKGEAAKVQDQATSDKAAKLIAFAATLSVALKILISLLTQWKGFFKTDKQKAWLKLGLVGGGFLVFLTTNLGFGIPWWQSLILAGGGPGSILVHELTKLVPVLKGQKKYSDVEKDSNPPEDGGAPPPEVSPAPPAPGV